MKKLILIIPILFFTQCKSKVVKVQLKEKNVISLNIKGNEISFYKIKPSEYGSSVDDFFMMEYEVTNSLFKLYLSESKKSKGDELTIKKFKGEWSNKNGIIDNHVIEIDDFNKCWKNNDYPHGKGNYPVNLVDLVQVKDFSIWLSSRYKGLYSFRLPTEKEWLLTAYGNNSRSSPLDDGYNKKWSDVTLYKTITPEGVKGIYTNVSELVIEDKESMSEIGISPQKMKWMGNSYLIQKKGNHVSYWGYTHSSKSRKQDLGFRLVLDILPSKDSP